MAWADMESAKICKRMLAAMGEIYPGSKIEALCWEYLLSFPRIRVWLTAKTENNENILKLLQFSNPKQVLADQ